MADGEFLDDDDQFEMDGGRQRRHGSSARRLFTPFCQACFPINRNIKRTSLRHLLIYCVFLLIVSIVSYGMRSDYQFYITRAMSLYFAERMFGDRGLYFNEMSSIPDIWSFLTEVVVPNLFPAVVGGGDDDNVTVTTSRYILRENYLLGLVRLRLLRVRNDSCIIHENFRPYIYTCYDEYSERSEDKSDFGLGTGTAWTHHTAEQLSESSYWGKLGLYDGSGYYEDLGPSYEVAEERIATLKQNFWIRRATRIVLVDFTVYNANVNLFSIVKFVLELPATGGVWPTADIHSMNLLRYVDSWDYFVLICEILFGCFTVYYLCEEIVEITRQRLTYVQSFWNLLDFSILTMSIVCIGFSVFRSVLVDSMLKKLMTDPDHYPPFGILAIWQIHYNNMVAALVFLCWIKVLKYLSFNRTMAQLSTTLSKCAKDVGGFGLMFCIVFMAYAQLGYLLFGAQLHDFSKFHLSVFTLLRLILGDFDFDAMRQSSRIMGPVFFVSYVFVVFFILLNMFLAIISDTYSDVKEELHKEPEPHELTVFLGKVHSKLRSYLCGYTETDRHSSQSETKEDSSEKKTWSETGETKATKETFKTVSSDADRVVNPTDVSKEAAKMEKLSNRVDDLTHELEQVQKVLVAKLDAVQKQLNRMVAAQTNVSRSAA